MNLPYSQIDGETSRGRWHVYWKGVWVATMFSRGDARWLLRKMLRDSATGVVDLP